MKTDQSDAVARNAVPQRVELTAEQKLRGSYRFGGFMLRWATRRQLDEALDGLERAVGAA